MRRQKSQYLDYLPTQRQSSIMIGSLLGDGCLSKVINNENSSFSESHCFAQYEWLKWKQKELNPLTGEIKIGINYGPKKDAFGFLVKDKNKKLKKCSLNSLTCKWLTSLEKNWYKRNNKDEYLYKILRNNKKQRIKVVPKDLVLDSLSLAVWYMDDGSNIKSKMMCVFATNGFSKREVKYLLSQIKIMGFYDSNMLETSQKGKFVIQIKRKSYIDFLNLVQKTLPELPECLKYKIDQSKFKTSWKLLPSYHPNSVFNDELVGRIFNDARNRMSQKDIASKYKINPHSISMLLKGKLKRYKSEFNKFINYKNKINIPNFSYSKRHKAYFGRVFINKEEVWLGEYKDKKTAKKVSKEVEKLRLSRCKDVEKYRALLKKYKKTKRNNSTGINGIVRHKDKYLASILINSKRIYLGRFTNIKKASLILAKAIKMKSQNIINTNEYIKLRPKIKRKYEYLPLGVTWSESRKRFIASFGRKHKYCKTLEEAITIRQNLINLS